METKAFFISKTSFLEIGGFPEIPIMEDFELVRRMKKKGKIGIIGKYVLASGRRWERIGVFKTTLVNQVIVILYYMGIPPYILQKIY